MVRAAVDFIIRRAREAWREEKACNKRVNRRIQYEKRIDVERVVPRKDLQYLIWNALGIWLMLEQIYFNEDTSTPFVAIESLRFTLDYLPVYGKTVLTVIMACPGCGDTHLDPITRLADLGAALERGPYCPSCKHE